jgi:hypothetical protein
MNRNLQGEPLSRAELMALAIEAGMPRSKIDNETKTWEFEHASRGLRHSMWARGELILNTRSERQERS